MSEQDFHYFSNGTEWDIWSQVWCHQCSKDHGMHNGALEEPQCPLIVDAMMNNEIKEWTDTSPSTNQYPSVVCSAFEQCEDAECISNEVRGGITYTEWCSQGRSRMRV